MRFLTSFLKYFIAMPAHIKFAAFSAKLRKKAESRFQSFESYESVRRNNILSRVDVFDAGLFEIDSIFYTCSELAKIGYFIHFDIKILYNR